MMRLRGQLLHPRAQVLRIELGVEALLELALRGGGTGLFEGCAAGDTAMAAVLRVGDR